MVESITETMMKLTLLGSGTAVPNGERNSAGFFLELPDACVMLDCGAGTVHALDRYRLPWHLMSHLFLSHFHTDHIGELASLLFAFRIGMKTERTEPLTIIGPTGLDRVIEGLKMALGSKLLSAKFPINVRTVMPGERFELGRESSLEVVKTPHNAESLAVRIENRDSALCYTGDTSYDERLAEFFREADVLISECSFPEPQDGVAHLSVRQAAQLAARARVRKLVVTHFYFDVNEAELTNELQREYSGEVFIGRDGLSISVTR